MTRSPFPLLSVSGVDCMTQNITQDLRGRLASAVGSLLSLALCLGLILSQTASQVEAKVIERVVALVNHDIVTLSELRELIIPIQMQLQSMSDPIKRQQILKEQTRRALEQLIDQKLLIQEAIKEGIEISDDQVDAHLQSVMSQQGWDEVKLEEYLTSQGITLATLKAQSKDFLLQQMISQRTLMSKVKVSESELKSGYRDFLTESASKKKIEGIHLFLSVPAGSDAAGEAAVKQQALELLNRAQSGEPLPDLIRQYSQGPQAKSGGDLGVIARRSGLPTALEEAFFELEDATIGGPVRTPFGYHLIQVTKRSQSAPPSFEQIRPQLEGSLRQKKFQSALKDWIDKLKKNAFIERRGLEG